MPSTYTSNGGIEKIGLGEKAGAWGTTTNNNFDIIDRLTNGVGDITLSGTTHTLTTSDGSLSDGMFKVLVLGGSPSGTNTMPLHMGRWRAHETMSLSTSGPKVVSPTGVDHKPSGMALNMNTTPNNSGNSIQNQKKAQCNYD